MSDARHAPTGTVHRLPTDFGFAFHFVNGYQDADGTLVVDALLLSHYPSSASIKAYLAGDLSDDEPQTRFVRFRLDLVAGTVARQSLADCAGELPEIHPGRVGQPYRYTWAIGRPANSPSLLFDHLLKLDVHTGEVRHAHAPATLCSEPVVVPRRDSAGQPSPREDYGYLVYLRFNADTSTTDLLVADAADLRPLARLRLPHNIPLGFHGLWQPGGGT